MDANLLSYAMGQGTVPCPTDRLGDALQTVGVAGRLAVLVLGNDHAVPIQNIPCERGCQIFTGLRRKESPRHVGTQEHKDPSPVFNKTAVC